MIEIINRQAVDLTAEQMALIERSVAATVNAEDFGSPYDVAVIVVDAPTIQQYNRTYRAKDRPTDVLSFIQYDDDGFVFNDDEAIFLGDIVLCYDIALAQARQYGHSSDREIAYLICHSTLHLLGYDHENEADKAEMRQREKAIMATLAVD